MARCFDPSFHIRTVTLVGLGGTGSQLSRLLARILYDMRRSRLHTPMLRFIDPDRVELKNCGRQSFCDAEVGQYKAEVLARRYNCALGLEIGWIAAPVSAERHFGGEHGHLVIGAVDNETARRELAAVRGLWLDCGNHFSSGQVILGNSDERENVLRGLDAAGDVVRVLPNAALLFPQLLEPEPALTLQHQSCADLVTQGTQHLLVNDWLAAVAAQYVYKLLHRQRIDSFMTYVNVDTLATKSLPISADEIRAYLLPV